LEKSKNSLRHRLSSLYSYSKSVPHFSFPKDELPLAENLDR